MALLKINLSRYFTAFFFHALFSAITLAFVLVFNDMVDNYLINNVPDKDLNPKLKIGIHIIIVLVFTFMLAYVFKLLFGWGAHLLV